MAEGRINGAGSSLERGSSSTSILITEAVGDTDRVSVAFGAFFAFVAFVFVAVGSVSESSELGSSEVSVTSGTTAAPTAVGLVDDLVTRAVMEEE